MLYFIRQAEATASHLVTKCSQGSPHFRKRKMFSSVLGLNGWLMPSVFLLYISTYWRGDTISKELRVNNEIRAREVRVVDANGDQLGIMNARDALGIAGDRGLDLVEVAPNAKPPCLQDHGLR